MVESLLNDAPHFQMYVVSAFRRTVVKSG